MRTIFIALLAAVLGGVLSLAAETSATDAASKETVKKTNQTDDSNMTPILYELDFEEGTQPQTDQYQLVSALTSWEEKSPISGKRSLLIDTTKSRAEWNPAFMTTDTIFQPNKTYRITFSVKFLEQRDKAYILALLRPLDANNHLQDAGFTEIQLPPKDGKGTFIVTTPDKNIAYAFQLHTRKQIKALVDNIVIREVKLNYHAATNETRPFTGKLELATGCEDFEVELPKLDNNRIFNGVDFGITPENQNNTPALQEAINKIRRQTPAKLVLKKGTYRFSGNNAVSLSSINDFEIDGQGSRLVFQKEKDKLFIIQHCVRTTLRNFSIDWDWEKDPLASVAQVENVSPENDFIDLRFIDYNDFPRKDVRIVDLAAINPQTRLGMEKNLLYVSFEFIKGSGTIPVTEWLEGNLLRMKAPSSSLNRIKKGMVFRIRHYNYDMNGIQMINNKHLTLDNVHIYSCPGMGIFVTGVQEYWQIINSSVSPEEGKGRLLSTAADQIHIGSSKGHFKLINTVIGRGGDDALNIHDLNCFAIRADDHRLLTKNVNFHPGNYYQAGDLIEFRNDDFSPTGFTAKIKTAKRTKLGHGVYEFTFDEILPEQKTTGFVLFNRRMGTSNVIVKGCKFLNFGRGILLMADNVTIEDNTFDMGVAGAIKIETGYTMNVWSEGYGASNVLVRNNRFQSVNSIGRYGNEGRPDIYISSYMVTDPSSVKSPYPIFNKILIWDNSFSGANGAHIFAASVGNLVVMGNTFDDSKEAAIQTDCRGAIMTTDSSNVYVVNNLWKTGDIAVKPGVIYNPETTKNIVVSGNKIEK